MFKKIFPLFIFAFLLVCFFASLVVAQEAASAAPAVSSETVPAFDIKTLPSWLQWLLSGLGIGGLGFWAVMKTKVVKYLRLFEDLKLFVTATIDMVSKVKEIITEATPEIKNAWYKWLHSAGVLLIETGNKSLEQKGRILIEHIPPNAVINKTSGP